MFPAAAGAWGLRAHASFAFHGLSPFGVEPFGTTEQGQSPPEASGSWRPLKAKGCITSPLAAEAQAREVLTGGCRGLAGTFPKTLACRYGSTGSQGGRVRACVHVCVYMCVHVCACVVEAVPRPSLLPCSSHSLPLRASTPCCQHPLSPCGHRKSALPGTSPPPPSE